MNKILGFFTCSVIMALLIMTSPTHNKSAVMAPLASVAYAEKTMPTPLTDCPCQIAPDGLLRDCNGAVCTENGSAIKTENNSANSVTSTATNDSLSVWARALISVMAYLAFS